ncbi:MAG: metalloregulator ArsR/SmtB family transcription factor [Terriglobales bacterium]|jgi:DNA-binding transcriptional ArsR family regulator
MRNRLVTDSAPEYSPAVTFHALADPTRLAVLDLLRSAPRAVGHIASAFPISRPAISKHLRQLQKARLVVPSRRGRHHFYQLNAAPLEALDLWLERYRMFWAHNLTNLKFFVEQEHARETGEIASNTRGNTPAKTRSKHK